MTEAFKISENNKNRRDAHKKIKDRRATLVPLEIGERALVRSLSERGGQDVFMQIGSIRSILSKKKR